MNELSHQLHRVIRISFFLLAGYVLAWGFSDAKSLFAGLLLGTAISMINSFYTAFKIQQLRRIVEEGAKKGSLGMLFRFGTASFGALIAVRYPETFLVTAYVVGLVTTQFLAFADGVYHLWKNNK